jgi:signal transduction histidine kinase
VKRTSWISWRIYFVTLPIDIVVLILAADHKIRGWDDVFIWGFVALMAHASLIPFIAIGVTQSQQWRSWKFDLSYLFLLGAMRGITINYGVDTFDLEQTVSDGYKVFNSMVALPQWFVGVAVFFESRRNYQNTFRELFAKAMRREQETHERQNILPSGTSSTDEAIARLQFITSNLATDIQKLLKRPDALNDYTVEANKIQHLIDENIRPVSAELWRKNKVNTPKISFLTLVQIALLESRLRVFLVVAISVPYLFVGLNGAYGFEIAIFQCILITIFDVSIFAIAELLHRLKLLKRNQTNILLLVTSFFLPFFVQFDFVPEEFAISSSSTSIFFGQLLLSMTYLSLLIAVNGYSVVNKQRKEVIASLEKHIAGGKYSTNVVQGGTAQRNTDLANYLHGEIQAGLTASSLLLQQAAKSGDSDLAQEALERASGLLNQDLTNISYTRMAKPDVKIQKIVDAWKGIADISVALPPFDQLVDGVLRNSVQLIEEAVANSIRHAKATDIKISGVLKKDLLTITIISNGDPMTKGKAGLGTKMFNDLSVEWNYASESGHNRLTFTLVNQE